MTASAGRGFASNRRRNPALPRIAKRLGLVGLGVGLVLPLAACQRGSKQQDPPAGSRASAALQPAPARAPVPDPKTLLDTAGSAYAAFLVPDGEANYVLTDTEAFHLTPDRAPVRWGIDLGPAPVVKGDHFLFWLDEAFRQVPCGGGEPSVVAEVAHQPRRVVSSGNHFAWLDRDEDDRFTIRTLSGSQPRVVHDASSYVAAMAMQDDLVYFVERESPRHWRLGVVPLAGGKPRFSETKPGRTPAMLALAGDVFYYDGPTFTVRRMSSDLTHEEVIARDVICSPIAVAEHLYCAQPAGLLEIGFDGNTRRQLPLSRKGSITAITATAKRLTWLMDVGNERLAVESIPLTPPGAQD